MKRPDDELFDPALDEMLADTCATIDDELRQSPVPWDFAAVIARAHALDPSRVSADDVAEAQLAAPVVSLAHERRRRPTRDDMAFEQLIADVRVDAEHDAALRMHGVTALPKRAEPKPLRKLVWGAIALAAALVLTFGLLEGVRYVQRDRSLPADAALHEGAPGTTTPEQAIIDDGEHVRVQPRAVPDAIAPEAETTIPSEPAPLEEPVKKPKVAAKAKPKAALAPPLPSLAERIAAIDAEAHAAWKARDYAKAEDRFEALIELAGSSRLADLAYGDLFTLARRRGDAGRERALWTRYLSRFPEGRFADDARAGLCRRAGADSRVECWREYLDDFPAGSFRAQAEREVAGSP